MERSWVQVSRIVLQFGSPLPTRFIIDNIPLQKSSTEGSSVHACVQRVAYSLRLSPKRESATWGPSLLPVKKRAPKRVFCLRRRQVWSSNASAHAPQDRAR